MGMLIECGKEKFRLGNIIKYLKYKISFAKNHPSYFDADGLLCFVGPQGSGKTLSAVNYIYNILRDYPGCKMVTNILIDEYPIVTFEDFYSKHLLFANDLKESGHSDDFISKEMFRFYVLENRIFPFNDNDDFGKYENGEEGVLYFVDEIQLYLNSLESKNINMDTMTQISQQRKQRKHIVCTCQVFGRMAKPLREQFSNVVVCKNYLGILQVNKYVDRDSLDTESSSDTKITGQVKKKFMWLHSPDMYSRYDTYYVIKRGKFVGGEQQKEVYDNGTVFKLSANN